MEGDDKETQVKWIKFGHADSIAFLGKDTVMMGFGLHILFVDTSRTDKKEVLYQASSDVRGDGVQCVCAHRVLPCFALAEKCRHPRIIINSYPSFETIKVIEAFCETSYVAIRFSEMEYLVALTSLPDYSIVIWNWRTLDKMYSQATGIESPNQILRVSFSSPLLIAQANPNDQTLTLWEMNVCYKKTLLDKFKVTLPPSSRSPYSYCWGADGDLYCLDSIGNLYTIDLQTKECQLQISSSKQQQGRATPSLTWYKGGLVLNVPREVQFWRRKSPEGWIRMWSLTPQVPFEALVSATSKDNLVGWTEAHDLVQLISKGEHNIDCVSIRRYGANFDFACFINPIGEYFVSFGKKTGLLTVWNKSTGEMVSTLSWTKSSEVTAVGSNPKWPYLIAVRADGKINTFNLFDPTYPMELNEAFLSRNRLDAVRFWRSGAQFCVASRDIGEFFLVKLQNDSKLDVSATIKINFKIADYVVAETSTAVKLLVLPVSQLCCRSGHTLLVYQVEENLKTFKALQDITLPMLTIALQPAANQDELLCIPHRSRSVYILRCEGNVEITKKFVSGHQMKLFGMRCDGKHLLTFGVEGIVIVRAALETTCISLFNTHHRGAKGVKDIAFDPYCQHVVSLGEDGTLVCTRLMNKSTDAIQMRESEALMKSQQYRNTLLNPIFGAKARARALEKAAQQESKAAQQEGKAAQREGKAAQQESEAAGEAKDQTWLELQEELKVAQEEQAARKDKTQLYQDFLGLQEKLKELLDTNYGNPPEEQLATHAFDLDKATRRKRLEDGKADREKVKQMEMATTKALDKISDYMRKMCWDTVHTKGKEVHAIVAPLSVQSYALLSDSKEDIKNLTWTEERLRVENFFHTGDYFAPWVPLSDSSLDLLLKTKFYVSEVNVAQSVKTKYEEEEPEEQAESAGEDKESSLVWTGTASHNFITINPNHRSQFELTTYFQGSSEIRLIEQDIKQLMLWFNKQFGDMFSTKEREMASVFERNNRFRHIINELNFFHFSPEICKTVVVDPDWSPAEYPGSIVKVDDKEIDVPLYISPSEQEILDKKMAEEERMRKMLLADDFRERALVVMMDGVLEKLWEDEIKKNIPKPRCMVERDAETWTEDDHKAIKMYEESVKFLTSERERYRKILEAEFAKQIASIKDSVAKFDDKVAKLHLLKLKVESAIGQEVLKMLRIRHRNFQRMDMDRKEEAIKVRLAKNEKRIEAMQAELSKLQETLSECKNHHESLQNRDRNLDKNFKKDFPEYSPIICEQLYKLSKKRPKLLQKASMFSTVLTDMGKCAISGTKPDHLPIECIQYLKDIDGLDAASNAPAVVSEQSWELMCKLRRIKIESELKIRACANDLADAESTVVNYQKNFKACKEEHAHLLQRLQSLRDEKLLQLQNFQVQLVLKQAFVEISTSGCIADFDDAIFVTRAALLDINGVIRKVGMQKIKAMIKAANFRKGIIFTEWQHKKLRMEIEDLENKLDTVEKIKVTKELQAILTARARGFSDEKGFLYLENEILAAKERFEKARTDILREIDEVNMKIDKTNKQNEELDERIADVNIKVNELSLQTDKELEKAQQASNNRRMKMVRERSRLVQKIQQQHNEILVLQTELELLRLRTFPTIKYKMA